MATNVLENPGAGTITFTDSSGTPQTIVINGSTLNVLAFTGSVASTLVLINDSIANTGTLNPGANDIYLGSSTGNRWNVQGTSGHFNRTLTLENPGGSSGAQLHWASSTAPSSPTTGDTWFDGTNLYFYNGTSNINLLGGGTVTGTGTANQLAYWSATSALTGSANLTFTSGNVALTGGGKYTVADSGGSTVSINGNISTGYYQTETNPRWQFGRDAVFSGVSGFVMNVGNNTIATSGSAIGQATSTSSTLSFYTSNGTALTERMRLDGNGNLGIGTTAPSQRVDIAYGNLRFTTLAQPGAATVATGSAGVLTGTYYYYVTFVTSLGETNIGTISALVSPSSQQVNLTNIPVDASSKATARNIYRSVAAGTGSYLLTTLSNNTATTYTDNTADGSLGATDFTKRENTTAGRYYIGSTLAGFNGVYNTSFGFESLQNNVSGSFNAAFGINALGSLTTGSFNTSLGYAALQALTTGAYNIAVGDNSGISLVTGNSNVLIGHGAGAALTGGGNIFIGYATGWYAGGTTANETTTGSNNVFIGIDAGQASPTQISNSIAVGTNAVVTGSNQAALGGTGSNAVKVGINNNNPSTAQLSLNTDAVGTIGILVNGAASQTANLQNWSVNGSVLSAVSSAGYLGIGAGTPLANLDVRGPGLYAGVFGGTLSPTVSTPLSSSGLEVQIGANSMITFGSGIPDDPAITLYRTASGSRSGVGFRIMTTTAGSMQILVGNNTTYGSETYTALHTFSNTGTVTLGGGLTVTTGGLTVSAGGAAISGNLNVTAGIIKQQGDGSHTITAYLNTNSSNLNGTTSLVPGLVVFSDTSNVYGIDLGYNATTTTYRSRIFSTQDIALSTAATYPTNQSSFTDRLVVRQSGLIGINQTNPGAQLDIIAGSTTTVGLIVNSPASQTANLQNWAVNGSVLASMSAAGNFTTSGTITTTNTTASTTTSTGALIVSGGLGVAQNVYSASFVAAPASSTSGSPAIIGFSALYMRYQFDGSNGFQSATGYRSQIYSYWGLEIYGRSSGTIPGFATGSSTDPSLNVYGSTAANPVLVVTGATSQSGNLTEWHNSSGTTLAYINSAGAPAVPGITVNGNSALQSSVTITNGKTTLASATTSYASLNVPSGTAPTSPSSGDLWWNGTQLYFYNGSSSANLLGGGTVTGTGTANQLAYWSATTVLTGSANLTFTGSALSLAASLTITTAKAILAASTTSYASLNLPSGTSPTSPIAGDIWYNGTSFQAYTSATETILFSDFSNVSGTLAVANGGTNISSYTSGSLLYASASTTISQLTASTTNGAILISNGSNPIYATALPATYTFSGGPSFSNGATISGGTFTLNTWESASITVTSATPAQLGGRADLDIWQPASAPTQSYYAYYQKMEYANNQASSFAFGGIRSDIITTSGLTSATLSNADSFLSVYNPGGAGTVTLVTGFRAQQVATLAGTTTAYNGIRIEKTVTSGTITNSTGVFIDNVGNMGTVTNGSSIFIVSDGTINSGISWGTSNAAPYTADVSIYRSAAGTLSNTGILIHGGRTVFATATTSASSLNIPSSSGTSPTSPSSGDLWWDGTHLYFYNGSSNVNLVSSSVVTGSGTSGQVTYWNGGSTVTSSANLTFTGSALSLAASLTVTTAKSTFAAAATGYASINLPSGTAPTSPVSGDIWWDGTHLYIYNGSSNVNILGLTGSGTSNQVAYFNGGTSLTSSANFTFSGSAMAVAGSLTITTAKTTLAAAATGYASLNIPSGTAPTSPVSGDTWFDGTNLYFYNGTSNINLLGGGTVTGTGTANQLAYWSAGTVLTGSSAFTVSGTTLTTTNLTISTTFTLNGNEVATYTAPATTANPGAGHSDTDTWNPSVASTGDYFGNQQIMNFSPTVSTGAFQVGPFQGQMVLSHSSGVTVSGAHSYVGTLTHSGTGTTTLATGLRLYQSSTISGTITAYNGVRIEKTVSSGTITNSTGVFIDNVGNMGTVTNGSAIFIVSDGTAKSGITWGTSNATPYTADFSIYRSATGTATVSGKMVYAASTTSLASLNIPSGTAPTSPVAGDFWYNGTSLQFYTSATKTILFADFSNIGSSIVPVANGGTNIASYTAGQMLYASAATTFTALGIGASGTIMMSTGSAPSWVTTLTGAYTFSGSQTFSSTIAQNYTAAAGTANPTSGQVMTTAWSPTVASTADFFSHQSKITFTPTVNTGAFQIAAYNAPVTTAHGTGITVSAAHGLSVVHNQTGAGTTTLMSGVRVYQTATMSGTITAYNGLRVEKSITSGTLTNATGLFLDSVGSGGTVTNGSSIFMVSDGTVKTGITWGTSSAAPYTADVSIYRSGTSTVTVSGKMIYAATTTTYASINIPSGTSPTTPNTGDVWYDGTYLYYKDNVTTYNKRINKKRLICGLCVAFTPAATGGDAAEFVVPYHGDGTTSITWNVRRINFRVQTAGGTPAVTVEVSTATTAFSAATVGSVTLGSGAYEGNTTSFTTTTVASGNKLRINPTTITGGSLNWSVSVELEEL